MSVQSQIDRLNAVKDRIRTNLVAQGIAVPADTMLEEMASMILSVAGEDGKNAYQYAKEGGYTGTEADFSEKLAKAPVVVQSTAPEDTSVIWVDPDDNTGDNAYGRHYITPQMYGAKGDGVTDDTAAIQNALDNGGIIYFPTGVYKVTRQLTTNVPCTIRMERIYPSSYNEDITEFTEYNHVKTDYPTDDTSMIFGSRIETYATDGYGLLVTDGSSIDGLAIRAMGGFSGVVLKYDGSKGCRSYPSTSRIRHIKVDCDVSTIKPEAMFDFCPYGNYGTIVEDIIIGSNHTRQFAKYGFRSSLTYWANSIRLRDIVVDVVAEQPFYINTNGYQAKNWTISNVAIQTYPCKSSWLVPSHTNIVYISGLSTLYISGCKLWDVDIDEYTDSPTTVSGDIIYNDVISATAFGNDTWFDSLDTVLTEQLRVANELNLAKLEVSVTTDAVTGNHTVKLFDSKVEKLFVIPATALSDEQVASGVTQWMLDNADAKPIVGKNKLNPSECFDGGISASDGSEIESSYYWSSNYIEVSIGDIVRAFFPVDGAMMNLAVPYITEFDANKNMIQKVASPKAAHEIIDPNVKYIRYEIQKTGNYARPFADVATYMVTVNDSSLVFEPYTVTMDGGIAQYIDLDAVAKKIDLSEYAKISQIPSNTETWTFTLEDGSQISKVVYIK